MPRIINSKLLRGEEISVVNLAVTHAHRGLGYALMGENIDAIADYDQVIELDPTGTRGYNNRAWAYYKKAKRPKDYQTSTRRWN